jgi:hypothetical protein
MNSMKTFTTLLLALTAGSLAADEFSRWTWRVPSPPSIHFRHVVFAEGQFVAVGFEGAVITSTNGTNWFLEETVTTNTLQRIMHGERYVASGNYGTVIASQDGKRWQLGNYVNHHLLLAIAYGNETYVALDASGALAHSTNALAWTPVTPPAPGGGGDMTFGNGVFVAVGIQGMIITSTNGVDWVERESGTTGSINAIAFGDGRFVAVGNEGSSAGTSGSGFILSSPDGSAWFLQTVEAPLRDVTFGDGRFLILTGDLGPAGSLVSDDGLYFDGVPPGDSGLGTNKRGVACGNGVCVAVGNGVFLSDDGLTWTNINTGPVATIRSFAQKGQTVVGVGNDGVIITTTNGVAWADQQVREDAVWREVSAGDHGFAAVGNRGALATSPDGYTWTSHENVIDGNFHAIAYGAGRHVAVAAESGSTPYGYFVISDDGVNWEPRRPFANRYINASITCGAGWFVASGEGVNFVSQDGWSWMVRPTGMPSKIMPIKYLKGRFMGPTQGGIAVSEDGLNWEFTPCTRPDTTELAHGNGVYLATSLFKPVLWSSIDGLNWQQETIGVGSLRSAIYAYDSFWVGGTVLQSQSSLIPSLDSVIRDSGQLNAEVFGRIGREYELQSSTNLVDWTREQDYTQSARHHPLTLPTGPDQRFYRVKLKE